ncbi:MAG: AMP-binding protein, partial [Eubacteriales bacterium]|nr:AMP-binding protein [Eubacteriales bacterium]
MEEGKEALQSGKTAYTELPIDPGACSILIFTSGTSSLAKAVMLSQRNVLFDVHAMEQVEDIKYPDVCMAFLPFHHAYGIGGQLIMLSVGATTTFCDGLKYIQKNMVEYHVSTFIGVPILIEAIWKKILNGIEKQGAMKKFRRGIKLSNFLLKLRIDRRRKLFSDIYDQLGGSIHAVFSGASALDPECQQGFEDIGIHVCQGYGMTEASPVITTEDANDRKAGSIGKALPGIELAIADPNSEGIGELICRSPNVMLGYYNNPEETSKALAGGWLHTGDLAKADKDGFVYITGRAKNVIVLKNGKNVYPEELETLIEKLPYVKENIVIGEPRHNDGNWKDLALVAKIVYDKEYFHTVQGITETSEIEKYIRNDLDEINSGLPNYQRILRLRIQDTPMKKTTTGKVKRFEEGARKSF